MRKTKKTVPLYGDQVVIIQCDDLNEVGNLHEIDLHGCDAVCFAKLKKNGARKQYLAFGKDPSPGIIAHECFHFVSNIFNHRHIEFDAMNDEPGAYLLEWIVDECHKFLNSK